MAKQKQKKRKIQQTKEEDASGGEAPPDNESPEALVERVREKQAEKLGGGDVEVDLNHLIRVVQALLTTNEEILSRFNERAFFVGDGYFLCYRYKHVEVRSPTRFVARVKPEEKTFGLPEAIPDQLTKILAIEKKQSSLFPDYNSFFQRSLLLHNKVQGPFLTMFKEHLEAVQVYLGQIEAWLMEDAEAYAFVKDTFGMQKKNDETGEKEGVSRPNGDSYRAGDVLLKSFPWDTGEYFQSFDITCKKGRNKLVKFLEYLSEDG